ncbi:hypothetical protein GGI42DRAFT_38874 [Trichoderma sp. SZMC 28013]
MATSAVRSEIWRPETPFFSSLALQVAVPRKQGFGLDSATERFDVGDEQHWAINVHPSNVFLFLLIYLFAVCSLALVPGVRLLRCEINRINQILSKYFVPANKHHHHYRRRMRNSLNVKKCLFLYSLFG